MCIRDRYCVVNNTYEPQDTTVYTTDGSSFALHLVGPMGFAIDDKKLKHAGLDYWHYLDITYYLSLIHICACAAVSSSSSVTGCCCKSSCASV